MTENQFVVYLVEVDEEYAIVCYQTKKEKKVSLKLPKNEYNIYSILLDIDQKQLTDYLLDMLKAFSEKFKNLNGCIILFKNKENKYAIFATTGREQDFSVIHDYDKHINRLIKTQALW